jgi:hypothetical protein
MVLGPNALAGSWGYTIGNQVRGARLVLLGISCILTPPTSDRCHRSHYQRGALSVLGNVDFAENLVAHHPLSQADARLRVVFNPAKGARFSFAQRCPAK